ncbi:hypothetical protein [Defluviimonas salinarum]|uniref:Uncharacterized protein n=1 Tax=Defluviimonas salinarum TaxID=2992147 RepID=A0ABT3JA71_9RHOB|nr:hypothetical protein [Defluviimonas salinarum]MCW3784299.1 hypothetical protein [Defluviimonas salinarum]
MNTRIRAFDRLRELPEVFTLNTAAAMLGGDTNLASTYIARWKEMGFVSSLGPRTGVHFNLLRNPEAASERRMEAIAYLFPGAVLGGVSAVHAAGWTTQIPRRLEILIPVRRSCPAVDGVEIGQRPRSWFRKAASWIAAPGPVPGIDPAFALADAWKTGDWRPDPDDIEWDEVDAERLELAFAEVGLSIPEDWRDEMDGSRSGPGF